MKKYKIGEFENHTQEGLAKDLVAGKVEMLIIFYLANISKPFSDVAAVNAMYEKGLIEPIAEDKDEEYQAFKMVDNWKEVAGLPSDWDADKWLEEKGHGYSKDPRFGADKK